jgi:hypothetical protein
MIATISMRRRPAVEWPTNMALDRGAPASDEVDSIKAPIEMDGHHPRDTAWQPPTPGAVCLHGPAIYYSQTDLTTMKNARTKNHKKYKFKNRDSQEI